ncbi:hypothetical protein [Paratissierella segnis]|uniref:Uncharacterized protein n=1 Tax=Paratissierella segnis TaxID=2763679 RepID=A0A926ETD2_9FIRM|nr:hypothetical protein [Paratissierella segnis]MBC8587117.1 hypothetical protein [Paratissierella segnis]
MAINLGDCYKITEEVQYKETLYIELANIEKVNKEDLKYGNLYTLQEVSKEYFFPVNKEMLYADRILKHFNGYFVTQDNKGFDNGLLVGMMLSNSGII